MPNKALYLALGFIILPLRGYCDPGPSDSSGLVATDSPRMVNQATQSNPQDTAVNPVSQDAVNVLNPVPSNQLNYKSINKAGIYPAGGNLLIDRAVTVPTISVSSVTVSSINVTNKITIPNGSASSDAAAFGQLGGTGGTNSCGYVVGTIVQTVLTADRNPTTTSGTGYTSTTTAGTLSPKCSTDKIKITAAGTLDAANESTSNVYVSIFRGSSDLENSGFGFVLMAGAATTPTQSPCSILYLDSPNTTNSITYTLKIKSDVSAKGSWNGNGTGIMVIEDIAN